jgi:magnesium-transporting ATPase (P-type)
MLPIEMIGPLFMLGIGFLVIGLPIILVMIFRRGKQKREELKPKQEDIVKNYLSFARYSLYGSILSILFGLLHFYNYANKGSTISLYDAIQNAVLGIIFIVMAKLLQARNRLGILFFVLGATLSFIYPLVVGRGINWFALIFTPLIGSFFYRCWKAGIFEKEFPVQMEVVDKPN